MSLPSKALPAFLVVALLSSGTAGAQTSPAGLAGIVRGGESPIASAHVYAYNLADLELHKVVTDLAGRFQFTALPAGLYHIIAYKTGFVPAVVALTRPEVERRQVVDLHLVPEEPTEARSGEDFWSIRSQVPPEVLREIETMEVLKAAVPGTHTPLPLARFNTNLEASAGVDGIAAVGDAQMAGGRVGFEGRLDRVDIGLQGDFWRLEPSEDASAAARGSASLVSFNLKSEGDARFNLDAASNRLVTRQDGVETPVDFEHLRLSYSQPLGERGQSAFAAQVTNETNFYRRGFVDPMEVPQSSLTWRLEGSYSMALSPRSVFETGFKYRQRHAELAPDSNPDALLGVGAERVDVFGLAGYRVKPAMLIEYGFYSVLRGGEVALSPQGGVVLQLNPQWRAAARLSGRLTSEDYPARPDFLPTFHSEAGGCQEGEQACLQVLLSKEDDGENLTFGATHREIGETLRLYFSEDFFDYQESVYLVPGDRLPELQFAISRRLSPNVLARWRSNVAAGGGGTFYTARHEPYENDVRYLVTSLDTQFQSTSTGVFVAFHQLQQELIPLEEALAPVAPLESKRLQLRLTQDLNVLLDLPADWAVNLDMELSRGSQLVDGDEDELRHRVLGGFAVRF